MKLLPLGASATALALLTVAAVAQPWGGDGPKGDPEARRGMMVEHLFDKLDTNGDDQITAEERAAARESRFKSVDTDGDGSISYEEFRAERLERAEQRWKRQFERGDANKDGGITQAEQDDKGKRWRGKHLERMDANGDGIITREEALTAKPPHHGKRGGMKGGKGDCPAPAPAGE